MTLNTAVVAPMPSAIDRMAVNAKPGRLVNSRIAVTKVLFHLRLCCRTSEKLRQFFVGGSTWSITQYSTDPFASTTRSPIPSAPNPLDAGPGALHFTSKS
jgi:hypothetical protein